MGREALQVGTAARHGPCTGPVSTRTFRLSVPGPGGRNHGISRRRSTRASRWSPGAGSRTLSPAWKSTVTAAKLTCIPERTDTGNEPTCKASHRDRHGRRQHGAGVADDGPGSHAEPRGPGRQGGAAADGRRISDPHPAGMDGHLDRFLAGQPRGHGLQHPQARRPPRRDGMGHRHRPVEIGVPVELDGARRPQADPRQVGDVLAADGARGRAGRGDGPGGVERAPDRRLPPVRRRRLEAATCRGRARPRDPRPERLAGHRGRRPCAHEVSRQTLEESARVADAAARSGADRQAPHPRPQAEGKHRQTEVLPRPRLRQRRRGLRPPSGLPRQGLRHRGRRAIRGPVERVVARYLPHRRRGDRGVRTGQAGGDGPRPPALRALHAADLARPRVHGACAAVAGARRRGRQLPAEPGPRRPRGRGRRHLFRAPRLPSPEARRRRRVPDPVAGVGHPLHRVARPGLRQPFLPGAGRRGQRRRPGHHCALPRGARAHLRLGRRDDRQGNRPRRRRHGLPRGLRSRRHPDAVRGGGRLQGAGRDRIPDKQGGRGDRLGAHLSRRRRASPRLHQPRGAGADRNRRPGGVPGRPSSTSSRR